MERRKKFREHLVMSNTWVMGTYIIEGKIERKLRVHEQEDQ